LDRGRPSVLVILPEPVVWDRRGIVVRRRARRRRGFKGERGY
jgi:hypothetical protein